MSEDALGRSERDGKSANFFLVDFTIDFMTSGQGGNDMKKTVSRLLALALTAALVLTGCSGGGASEGENGSTGSSAEAAEGEITDLYIPRLLTRELETFNILYSQRQEDSENLTNLIDGLLEATPEGTLEPGIAEE